MLASCHSRSKDQVYQTPISPKDSCARETCTMYICDFALVLKVASLVLTAIALIMTLFGSRRLSVLFLGVSLLCTTIVTFEPTCASVIDTRKMPIVGQPAH